MHLRTVRAIFMGWGSSAGNVIYVDKDQYTDVSLKPNFLISTKKHGHTPAHEQSWLDSDAIHIRRYVHGVLLPGRIMRSLEAH